MRQLLRRYADVLLACSLALVFTLWPQLDLRLAAYFYVPGLGFPAWQLWWVNLTYVVMAKLWIVALLWLSLLLFGFMPRFKRRWARHRLILAYLLAVLLLGPGLIANTLLKDHWGRPRPVHLVQFGGHAVYTPALQPSSQCLHNCSFVSGHAAGAFYPMAGYWVTRRRRWLLGGIVFGLFVGYVRMAMGAHFLSDVLFSGIVVHFTCRLLASLFFRQSDPRSLPAGPRRILALCKINLFHFRKP